MSGLNGLKDMVSFSLEVIFKYVYHHHIDYCTLPMGYNRLATLKARRPPYTWCTTVASLWDVDRNIGNILVQADSSYTSWKCVKRFLKIMCIRPEDRCIRAFGTYSYLFLL